MNRSKSSYESPAFVDPRRFQAILAGGNNGASAAATGARGWQAIFSGGSPFRRGAKAYVGNFTDNTVSAVDTVAGRVIATVPVATGPLSMATTLDGRQVLIVRARVGATSVARVVATGPAPDREPC